jgi:hypothetical protein
LQIQTRKRRNGRCEKIEVKINSEKLLYHGAQQEMEEHERNGEAAAGGATSHSRPAFMEIFLSPLVRKVPPPLTKTELTTATRITTSIAWQQQ